MKSTMNPVSGARLRALAGAASGVALMIAMGGTAHAQAATDAAAADEAETVVVYGIRRGIENAIAQKKDLSVIAEVVSAEDIGKLPDVSIAESIARLPGLAAQRLDGRAQQISIRGLGPDFTVTTLNGREQVSVGDNRGVEFDQYPSELLSGVAIYKTAQAGLTTQGIAGTADLQTIRPLKFGRRAFAVGARYEVNDVGALNAGSKDNGYRISASYIDQFMDGALGIAIGYARMESPYQANKYEAWGYPTVGGNPFNVNPNTFVIGGAKPYAQSGNLTRDGIMGVIEFKPTETLSMSVDAYYSKFEDTQILRGVELPLWWSGAQLQPPPSAVIGNGIVTSGVFNGVKGIIRNDVRQREAELYAIAGNVKWEVSDRWAVAADLSLSRGDRTDKDIETYSGTGRGGNGATDNLGFSTGEGGRLVFRPRTGFSYGDYNTIQLTDPGGWGQVGYYKEPGTEDELRTIRLAATRQFAEGKAVTDVEFGLTYSDREKVKEVNEWFLDLPAGVDSVAIPTAARVGTTDLSWLGLGPVVSYDPLAVLAAGVYRLRPNSNADVILKDWSVAETVTTGFIKFNLDTDLGDVRLTGNFGVQIVNTEQSSTAVTTGARGGTLTDGTEYTDVLPSMNLSFGFSGEQYFRVSLGRTMARARMDEMRVSGSFSYNNTDYNGPTVDGGGTPPEGTRWFRDSGNPYLEPWRANAVDFSYEKYWGRKAYVSLAVFYKQLESYIQRGRFAFDTTGLTPPTGSFANTVNFGYWDAPVNLKGGYIRGAEFALSIPFEVLFEPLEGFGIQFSASKNDSEITPTAGAAPIAVPGLSETIYNTAIYYERYGFQARLSQRYRSEFLGEVTGFGAGRELRTVQEESILDGQVGYTFQSGPLENLAILLQVNNITDEPFSTLIDNDPRRPRDYQEYGRTILFGVNYKF